MAPPGGRIFSPTDRAFVRNFIEKFKKHECLWNRDHQFNRDQIERACAIDDILVFYRTVVPDAQREHVTRKILSLRAAHYKEYKKVIASQNVPRRVHVPKLWYYNRMSFMNSQYLLKADKDQNDDDEENEVKFEFSEEEENDGDTSESSRDPLCISPTLLGHDEEHVNQMMEETAIQLKHNMEQVNQMEELAPILFIQKVEPVDDQMKETLPTHFNFNEEQVNQIKESNELRAITAFSEYTAAKLRTVSPSQRFLAERLISKILYLASNGALTDHI